MKKINLTALLVLIAAFTLGLAGFSLVGSADAAAPDVKFCKASNLLPGIGF